MLPECWKPVCLWVLWLLQKKLLTFFQSFETFHIDGREVCEQIFAAFIRVMKPKPFASLNHFTIPVAIVVLLSYKKIKNSAATLKNRFTWF